MKVVIIKIVSIVVGFNFSKNKDLKKIKKIGIALLMTFVGTSGFAQGSDSTLVGTGEAAEAMSSEFIPAQQKREEAKGNQGIEIGKLRVSGFSRTLLFYRNMAEYENYDNGGSVIKALTLPTTLGIGDGASQPMLMLRFEADVSSNTHFLVEQGFTNYLLANGNNASLDLVESQGADNPGRMAYVFNEFRFTADAVTNVGRITLTAGGGLTWRKLSPFTMWSFIFREDMFERQPYAPAGHNWRRYNVYYSTGDIPRDQRWGKRGVQGFIVDWKDIPGNFNVTGMFGKSTVSAGYNQFLRRTPQNMVAGRVSRPFGSYEIGVNAYNQFGYDTSIARVVETQLIKGENVDVTNKNGMSSYTADVRINYSSVRLYGEFGVGSYFSGTYHNNSLRPIGGSESVSTTNGRAARPWSKMLYAEADFKKDFLGFPFKVQAFSIGRHAVNNTSSLFNSSINEATNGLSVAGDNGRFNTLSFQNMLTEVTQTTNNRNGLALTTRKKFGKIVAELGLGMQQEIENIAQLENSIVGENGYQTGATATNGLRDGFAFYHIVNQYQRQRFNGVTNNNGPYGNIIADFRRSWSNIQITDETRDTKYTGTGIDKTVAAYGEYKKSYSMLDLGFKYKSSLFKKELILTAFGRANSIQDKFSPIPVYSDKAFLRQWFTEFMGFYHLNKRWTLVGFVSHEWAKGNKRTALADEDGNAIEATAVSADEPDGPTYQVYVSNEVSGKNGIPIDQRGLGYGLGFDYDFSETGSVDLRARRYTHKDLNFTDDKFDGFDVTVELKIYF